MEAAEPYLSLGRGTKLAEERERGPEVRRNDLESTKVLRHHADNVERRVVHADRAVDHGGVAGKMLRPGSMAKHKNRRAARLVVQGCECAPKLGADSEHLEEISRDERPFQPIALDPGVELFRSRECIGETPVSRMNVSYCGRVNVSRGSVVRSLTLNREQLVRVRAPRRRETAKWRIVNTTATSPRPSPTVITIVRAAIGARRNKRHV